MKVKFDIECTPEEARQFLGLPNVVPMQETVMKELEAKIQENIQTMDPENLVKTWLPATMQGWSEMQKIFWAQMGVNPGMQASKSSDNKE